VVEVVQVDVVQEDKMVDLGVERQLVVLLLLMQVQVTYLL
jgi:hypothetical protein